MSFSSISLSPSQAQAPNLSTTKTPTTTPTSLNHLQIPHIVRLKNALSHSFNSSKRAYYPISLIPSSLSACGMHLLSYKPATRRQFIFPFHSHSVHSMCYLTCGQVQCPYTGGDKTTHQVFSSFSSFKNKQTKIKVVRPPYEDGPKTTNTQSL